MTIGLTHTGLGEQAETRKRLLALSLVGALVPYAVLIAMTLVKTGGVFEYALDDVYIHLAMSEQVARGGYGVNPGEAASASSSILYSYLLAPMAGFAWHHWWPLILGLIALVGASLLWARVLHKATEEGGAEFEAAALLLALLGPMVLHFQAMALIGMEHMLHVMLTLLLLNGLLDFAKNGRVGWMLVVGTLFNPLLRFEGASIAILACAVVFFAGHRRSGVLLLVASFLPLLAHFWHMSQLGLDLLPNSVNAKAAVTGGGDGLSGLLGAGRFERLFFSWKVALNTPSGRTLLMAVFAGFFGLILARRRIKGVYALIGWSFVLACLAHILFGSTAKFYRYELYVWTYAVGVGLFLIARLCFQSSVLRRIVPLIFTASVLYGGMHYPVAAFREIPAGGAAIHAQQRQMGLFVARYWQDAVAVNDLGHVAYRNPHYVLDLWGLASAEALEARLRGTDELWADKLAAKNDVRVAMVYKHWLNKHIPPHWQPVAKLKLTIPLATLGGNIVTFYAITPDAEPELREKLKRFQPELPASAELTFVKSVESEG
ncbi:MAG: hypothetical protein GY952_18550 [Rhodobacteraceae bacterium]|nr:hypothetical protein [Paracoccaceae bacterium]